MGIKNLAAWLAVIVGFSAMLFAVPNLAVIHEANRRFAEIINMGAVLPIPSTFTIVLIYISLFLGLAMVVMGSFIVMSRKKNTGVIIALLVVTCLAFDIGVVIVILVATEASIALVGSLLFYLFVKVAIIALLSIQLDVIRRLYVGRAVSKRWINIINPYMPKDQREAFSVVTSRQKGFVENTVAATKAKEFDGKIQKIQMLRKLRDEGVLTEDEYKERLLKVVESEKN